MLLPAPLVLYVSQVGDHTPSDFLIPKMRRRIPLKSLGLRKETTFIPSPPNKNFCTEPRQTAPAGPPVRPIKTAPEKNGPPKAPRQTQSKSFPCCFPGISQAAPPLRKDASGFSQMLTFSICPALKSVQKNATTAWINLWRREAAAFRFSQKPRRRRAEAHC